ncbi:EamA/RhaT family transporter, partial [Escherichia coli]|nr:EamA/RhaT family transporter [Escherichia coli]
KGSFLPFLGALSWGPAIVMSTSGAEDLDAGGAPFWQICRAVIISWIVLFINGKAVPLNSTALLAYAIGYIDLFLANTFTL